LDTRTRLQHTLDQLEAQDFSDMGYEARIRHQQRIAAIRAEIATLPPPGETARVAEETAATGSAS